MKVRPLATFEFSATIPDRLRELRALAYNYLWSWSPEIRALFRMLDEQQWEISRENPVRMLHEVSQQKLDAAALSPELLEYYDKCIAEFTTYMSGPTWFEKVCESCGKKEIVYFSMEYGIHESLPVYSGGLGVLSGDHLKTASDLGLPLVAVGLAYRQGYFKQQLSRDGYQTELYPENDFHKLGVSPVLEDGRRVMAQVQFPGRMVNIAAWRAQVGRVPLYLLDTDLPENEPADRRITHALYGGDKETRIQQELILGIGGAEMVTKLGIDPLVCHMNEGHSAFVQIARVMRAMADGLTVDEAFQLISTGTVFTTHTPVPAGIDQFPLDLMNKYLLHYVQKLGLTMEKFMTLAGKESGSGPALFNMAIFAIRTSDYTNAVSRLHADVSRNLWAATWSALPTEEIPIDYVTNGIHTRTWLSDEMRLLYDRYLDRVWRTNPDHKGEWEKVRTIPDDEIWQARQSQRARLVQFSRERTRDYRARTAIGDIDESEQESLLDPQILAIGFARRFATYKRATLILRYPERLLALLRDPDRPVQFVFAGKAHPQDEAGKAFIHDLIYFARTEKVQHRFLFIENYDMAVARHLVEGVDVWLNNPRRPLEASGTSGMKVLANGGLNFSILDGWWDEAYSPRVGWSIGRGRAVADEKTQDDRDAQSLFDTLEQQIIPTFYTRGDDRIPHAWVEKIKQSICELVPRFSTSRMVKEYCTDYYIPSLGRAHEFASNGKATVRLYTAWRNKVEREWSKVKVESVSFQTGKKGGQVHVDARIDLGALTPDDVEVQVYYGALNQDGSLKNAVQAPLPAVSAVDGNRFSGEIEILETGRIGYTIRVIPSHTLTNNPLKLGLVTWADGSLSA